jgi:hypothetical protein
MTDNTANAVEDLDTDFAEHGDPQTAPPAEVADVLPGELRQALASLDDLDDLPVSEHVERYQQIHAGLQSALSDIEGV